VLRVLLAFTVWACNINACLEVSWVLAEEEPAESDGGGHCELGGLRWGIGIGNAECCAALDDDTQNSKPD